MGFKETEKVGKETEEETEGGTENPPLPGAYENSPMSLEEAQQVRNRIKGQIAG